LGAWPCRVKNETTQKEKTSTELLRFLLLLNVMSLWTGTFQGTHLRVQGAHTNTRTILHCPADMQCLVAWYASKHRSDITP
jgi:hypothetical protein